MWFCAYVSISATPHGQVPMPLVATQLCSASGVLIRLSMCLKPSYRAGGWFEGGSGQLVGWHSAEAATSCIQLVVSLTLLVEVSRLSSPLTGRVEILNYKREWRCHGSS